MAKLLTTALRKRSKHNIEFFFSTIFSTVYPFSKDFKLIKYTIDEYVYWFLSVTITVYEYLCPKAFVFLDKSTNFILVITRFLPNTLWNF